MSRSRGKHIPAHEAPAMIVYLEDAIKLIEVGMRNQRYKDVAIGYIRSEINELKELQR